MPSKTPTDVPSPPAAGKGGAAPASPTQSLDRALALLDLVVASADTGLSLAPLAAAAGLSKPTAHRLLTGLRNAGLIDYNPASRLFSPAFKLYQMGQKVGGRFDVAQLAGPGMDRIAEATEDTVYLSIRSGDQAICVARRTGAFPIRTLTLEVGDSRPLGLGAGNLALLAALPDGECEQVIARNHALYRGHPNFDAQSLREYVARTRADGYALNYGLMMPEMAAIGVALHNPDGTVNAALSVAAIKTRMQADRRAQIVGLLRQEAAEIERMLALPPGERYAL